MMVSPVDQYRAMMVSAAPHSPARRMVGIIVDTIYQPLYNRADS
jgi:hypothetical protein